MPRMPGVRFVVPRSFSRGRPAGPPRFIVIHYTAGSESRTAAEDGVAYDQRRSDGTSSHFFTDRDSRIQCVDTNDRAHTARYNGNNLGIHIEQCGSRQAREQWLDEASRETIRNTAQVCAWLMRTHGIPLVRLVGRQVRTGRGICGHADITAGFPEDHGTHEDPGPAYPWDVLFDDIRHYLNPAAKSIEEDDMPLSADDIAKVAKAVNDFRVDGDWLSTGRAANQTYRYFTTDGELRKVLQSVAAGIGEVKDALDALVARLDAAPADTDGRASNG